MQVAGRGDPEQLLQIQLARGRVQQVGAADHGVYSLPGVVDDHRQLVSIEAIAAANDEVAHLAAQVLTELALHAINKMVFQLGHAQADGRILSAMAGIAAKAGVDALVLFQLLA